MVVNAFPILFLSLVYHNVVPTLVTQLEGDRRKITQAIIGGTTVPLLMFLSWNAIIIGNTMDSLIFANKITIVKNNKKYHIQKY